MSLDLERLYAEAVTARARAMTRQQLAESERDEALTRLDLALSPSTLRQAMMAVAAAMISDDYPGNPDYIDTATIEQIAAALRALVTGETA